MNLKEYVIVPELVKIKSNVKYVQYFSLGDYLDNAFFLPTKCLTNFEFIVDDNIVKNQKFDQKFHFFYGEKNGNAIYFERPLLIGQSAKMLVEFFDEKTRITVNNSYIKFVRLKIDNLYPAGVHLNDIVIIGLLKHGFTPLHCSCITKNNVGILISAPPDTGKSLTSFLATERGYNFISEDIAIINKETAYPTITSTFLHFAPKKSYSHKLHEFISKLVPILAYIHKPQLNLLDSFPNLHVQNNTPIKKICFLEKGEESIQNISKNDAMRKLLIINRNEFSYYKNPLIFAYSYLNENLDVNELMKKEEEILRAIVNTNECFVLKSNEPKNYIKMIDTIMKDS
jgi:hypothetical protein